ncbi:hypothetical protein [Streptomyces peucetius]|nr:hypothetical protein CGZ69_34320 [Streptomyces peucetius subsp. caesius ATCC 27952]
MSEQSSPSTRVAIVTGGSRGIGQDAFTSGTNHFATGDHPFEQTVVPAYEQRYAGLMDQVAQRLAALAPADADASQVADAIVEVVDTPHGERPFRVHVDPANDGSQGVSRIADRVRAEFLTRMGLDDLLTPHKATAGKGSV